MNFKVIRQTEASTGVSEMIVFFLGGEKSNILKKNIWKLRKHYLFVGIFSVLYRSHCVCIDFT